MKKSRFTEEQIIRVLKQHEAGSKTAARQRVVDEADAINVALEDFRKLLGIILKAEAQELPDLEAALDDLLDELESAPNQKSYDRPGFRKYLMIPSTKTQAATVNAFEGLHPVS